MGGHRKWIIAMYLALPTFAEAASVKPSDVYFVEGDDTQAYGSGFWHQLNHDEAIKEKPMSYSTFWCERTAHFCYVAFATVDDSSRLDNFIARFRITSWNADTVQAVSVGFCITDELTVNLKDKEALRLERKGGTNSAENCAKNAVFKISRPVLSKLMRASDAEKQQIAN